MCISDIRCKMENHLGDSFDMNLSLCAVKIGPLKGEELLFLSFWTNFRQKWGVPINISLVLVILLYSWVSDVDIRLMITEAYLEPSQTVTMGLFAKIVNGWKLLTNFCKKAPL